jgi:hypothetical protein
MRTSRTAACFKSRKALSVFSCFRRALTLGEVSFVICVALALIGLFVLTLPYIHIQGRPGLSRRTTCSSNLKMIGTAMYTYGNENKEMWPISLHAEATDEGMGRVRYAPGKIGAKRMGVAGKPTPPQEIDPAAGGSTTADTELSTTRSLWVLVRAKAATPNMFICPSSDDESNEEDNPEDFYDFQKYTQVSYGFQIPYGKLGQPSSDRDQRMPLAADKGPYGAALEMNKQNPGIPKVSVGAGPDDWMKWNSPNHTSEGQVVLYADSHADFQTRPTAGINNDNIYTRWSGSAGYITANESDRAWGVPPTGRETPWSDTDTLIYP